MIAQGRPNTPVTTSRRNEECGRNVSDLEGVAGTLILHSAFFTGPARFRSLLDVDRLV
jgi:hypothetical protein